MKTLRSALILIVLGLLVPAPTHAKDQWVAVVSDYVMIHLYDALVDFTGPDLALKPMLAVRWEHPNPTTWRFTLRRGVKFHNGDPLTAEDVKFTLDTQLANKGSSINAYLGPTESARVVDPQTVEITTKTPFPPLLFNLTRLHILPRAYAKVFAGTVDESRPGCVTLEALGPIRVDVEAWRRVGKGAVDVLVRPERLPLATPGADPALPNQLGMEIAVLVNYGDSVLVAGSARGQRLRMRLAGAQPDAIREGATVVVGWKPGDEHLIARS